MSELREERPHLVRRAVVVLLVVMTGTLGYLAGSWQAPPSEPPATGTLSTSSAAIDWGAVSDRDLTASRVFLAARDQGLPAALDTLVALVSRDETISRQSHAIAHALGRYAVARNQFDPSVLLDCRPLFKAGCQHGVIEGYLAAVPSVDPVALSAFCLGLDGPGRPVIDLRECAHGLGHGLLDRLGYDIPGALRACDAFQDGALREECHDGVFMQNVVRGAGLPAGGAADRSEHAHGAEDAHAGHVGGHVLATFRADDLTYPCSRVDAAYQGACWSYQPLAITRYLRDRGARTLAACELAPEGARERCFAGYGKQAFTWLGRSEEEVMEMCATLPERSVDYCLNGVVEWHMDDQWAADAALAFCDRVHESGRSAVGCYAFLGERVALLHAEPGEVERECTRAVLPHYVEACRRGAGLG